MYECSWCRIWFMLFHEMWIKPAKHIGAAHLKIFPNIHFHSQICKSFFGTAFHAFPGVIATGMKKRVTKWIMKSSTHNVWSHSCIWKDVVPSRINSQWLFSVFFISGADLITTRERGSPARLQSKHRSRFIITLMTIGNFVRGDLWGALRSRKKCHSFFWAKKLSRPPMLHRDVASGG